MPSLPNDGTEASQLRFVDNNSIFELALDIGFSSVKLLNQQECRS